MANVQIDPLTGGVMKNGNGQGGTRRAESTARGGAPVVVTSTEAQNAFGRVLDTVARDGTVMITKHGVTQAVVVSADRYEALTRTQPPSLDLLTAEFDAMLERMQAPGAEEAMLEAFRASPEELARAAVAAARQ
jgi:antitoxin Phd